MTNFAHFKFSDCILARPKTNSRGLEMNPAVLKVSFSLLLIGFGVVVAIVAGAVVLLFVSRSDRE